MPWAPIQAGAGPHPYQMQRLHLRHPEELCFMCPVLQTPTDVSPPVGFALVSKPLQHLLVFQSRDSAAEAKARQAAHLPASS